MTRKYNKPIDIAPMKQAYLVKKSASFSKDKMRFRLCAGYPWTQEGADRATLQIISTLNGIPASEVSSDMIDAYKFIIFNSINEMYNKIDPYARALYVPQVRVTHDNRIITELILISTYDLTLRKRVYHPASKSRMPI